MSTDSILDWLSTIPDDCASESLLPRKRRRLDPITPTPETSDNYNDVAMSARRAESPNKRQVPIEDETPRSSPSKRIQTSASDLSYLLSDRSQPRSGRQSPQKHLQMLSLNPRGIRFQHLADLGNMTASFESFLDTFDRIMEGKGIVSTSVREALTLAAQSHRALKWACQGDEYYSDSPSMVGLTPSPEAVMDILAADTECTTYRHPEANWNLEVHQRVLELAFRPQGQGPFKHLVNFMGCTTAAIMPEYGTPSPSKKVDFCIYIDPKNDPGWEPSSSSAASLRSVISSLRHVLPGNAVNFTDFAPLDQRPIALSIETKKPSKGFDGAKLQLGVWQMAHWAFLRQLAKRQSIRADEANEANEADEADEEGGKGVELPAFIPGVIVQGQDWHLVITTLDGQQTVLWHKVTIGNTSSTKGVYQLVRSLQVLREWAEGSYWPWLRELIVTGNEGQQE